VVDRRLRSRATPREPRDERRSRPDERTPADSTFLHASTR
jgi:hypothetical protein